MKPKSLAENQAQKGGAKVGQVGTGRQVFRAAEADEVRVAEVEAENGGGANVYCSGTVQMNGRSTMYNGRQCAKSITKLKAGISPLNLYILIHQHNPVESDLFALVFTPLRSFATARLI